MGKIKDFLKRFSKAEAEAAKPGVHAADEATDAMSGAFKKKVTPNDVKKAGFNAAYETRLASKSWWFAKPTASPMQYGGSAMSAMKDLAKSSGLDISEAKLTGWAGLAAKRAEMGKIKYAITESPLSATTSAALAPVKVAAKHPFLAAGTVWAGSAMLGNDLVREYAISDDAKPAYDTVTSTAGTLLKGIGNRATGVFTNGLSPTFNQLSNDLTYAGVRPDIATGLVTAGTFIATKKGLDTAAAAAGLDKSPATNLITTFTAGAMAIKAYNSTSGQTAPPPSATSGVKNDPRLLFAPE